MVELDEHQCWELLRSQEVGRLAVNGFGVASGTASPVDSSLARDDDLGDGSS